MSIFMILTSLTKTSLMQLSNTLFERWKHLQHYFTFEKFSNSETYVYTVCKVSILTSQQLLLSVLLISLVQDLIPSNYLFCVRLEVNVWTNLWNDVLQLLSVKNYLVSIFFITINLQGQIKVNNVLDVINGVKGTNGLRIKSPFLPFEACR